LGIELKGNEAKDKEEKIIPLPKSQKPKDKKHEYPAACQQSMSYNICTKYPNGCRYNKQKQKKARECHGIVWVFRVHQPSHYT